MNKTNILVRKAEQTTEKKSEKKKQAEKEREREKLDICKRKG